MTVTLEMKVEKMTLGGQGLGHLDGKVCFVNKAIPGETVRIEIIEDKKDYYVANPLEILQASPHRINPECPVFNRCGGCQLQHITYDHQLSLKREVFMETMKRIGKMEVVADLPFRSPPYLYRNRAQLPVQDGDGLKIGYFKPGTHRVVDHKYCPINHDLINRTLMIVRRRISESGVSVYDERKHQGVLRHLVIKAGVNTRQLFLTFVTNGRELTEPLYRGLHECMPELAGVTQNINSEKTNRVLGQENRRLWGSDFYEEQAGGFTYRIRTATFFQVNTPVFEVVLKTVRDSMYLTGNETVLDLYSGVGVLGSCLADRVKEVVAVEESEETVNDGKTSARANGVANIRFIIGDVSAALGEITAGDIAILDPPRKGTGPAIVDALARLKIKEVAYLSCNPATFARDAGYLRARNYELYKVLLFDMFPQTFHIEALGFFQKR
jgi:23S rRNA (uracil1939-C5)-methyltransferase